MTRTGQGGRLLIETVNVVLDEQACERIAGASPGAYVRLSVIDTGTGAGPNAGSPMGAPGMSLGPPGMAPMQPPPGTPAMRPVPQGKP